MLCYSLSVNSSLGCRCTTHCALRTQAGASFASRPLNTWVSTPCSGVLEVVIRHGRLFHYSTQRCRCTSEEFFVITFPAGAAAYSAHHASLWSHSRSDLPLRPRCPPSSLSCRSIFAHRSPRFLSLSCFILRVLDGGRLKNIEGGGVGQTGPRDRLNKWRMWHSRTRNRTRLGAGSAFRCGGAEFPASGALARPAPGSLRGSSGAALFWPTSVGLRAHFSDPPSSTP